MTQAANTELAAEAYVPLDLSDEQLLVYLEMSSTLGHPVNDVVEGIMRATPLGREMARAYWGAVAALMNPTTAKAASVALGTLNATPLLDHLKGILGLDPSRTPIEHLVSAGIRRAA